MSEVIAGRPAVTWDEFVRLPDDDRRELIDGVLEIGLQDLWREPTR